MGRGKPSLSIRLSICLQNVRADYFSINILGCYPSGCSNSYDLFPLSIFSLFIPIYSHIYHLTMFSSGIFFFRFSIGQNYIDQSGQVNFLTKLFKIFQLIINWQNHLKVIFEIRHIYFNNKIIFSIETLLTYRNRQFLALIMRL